MQPHVDKTAFGWIEIGARRYEHDVVIGLDGRVRRRKKKLSKRIYGTSHRLSEPEAADVYEPGMDLLLIGTGQYGRVELSDKAAAFFQCRDVVVQLMPTPKAAKQWNEMTGAVVALFHVTC
ncbi:MAG: hypothetical protein JXC32_16115 [Anaerolineae bacterium]|nr:hypothetical protein [Anaerolineae bacterium]